MIRDLVFVSALLLGACVVGLPFAAALPRTIVNRLLLAPALGLAAYAVAVTALYVWGVPTATGGLITLASGALGAVAMARRWVGDVRLGSAAFAIGAVTVLLSATLAPAWIGGPAFTSFQGNPYDMLNYEGMAYSYGAHSFAEIAAMLPGDGLSRTGSFAIDARNELVTRPAVAMVLSASYRPLFSSTVDAAYPFMAALLTLSWFSMTFLMVECLGASLWLGGMVAICFAVGFFGQYALDINAWAQLASFSVAVATLAAFIRCTGGEDLPASRNATLVQAVPIASLVGGLLYLYPESSPVFAIAIGAAAVCLLILRRQRTPFLRLSAMALGAAGGAALCLFFRLGTLDSLFLQTGSAPAPLGWAMFFSAYLFALPFQATLATLTPSQILADVAYAVDGAMGAYFAMPRAANPETTGLIQSAGVAFAGALLIAALVAIYRLRHRPTALMAVVAFVCALCVPAGLLGMHRLWEAGKAFSIASPLWLALLTLPVTLPRRWAVALSGPALVLLAAQVAFGAGRFAVAARIDGIGRHAPYPAMTAMKRSYLADPAAWRAALAGCRAVSISIDDAVMDRMVQVFLAQESVPWSTSDDVRGSFTFGEKIGSMPQVADPDCFMTDRNTPDPHGRLVNLRRAPAAAGTMTYEGGTLDIVDSDQDGVDVSGFYHLETIPNGFARWTDGDGHAYVTVPNGQRPGLLIMGLGMVAPVGDVTVRLNGRALYNGPQWTGPKAMPIPADVAVGPWTFDVESSTWSAPHDPRALGVYVTGFALGIAATE